MLAPTLGAAPAGGIAIDLLVILACAGVTALVLSRLRIAVIPGYLIAGIIFGPHAVGLVRSIDRVDEITSIATVLLMFSIGMHLDMSSLRRGAAAIVSIGVLSTLGTSAALAAAAMAFGLDARAAIAIGMALSMSSTAVVLRLLQARRELFTAHGRTSIGVLLVQDLLVVGMLALLPVLVNSRAEGDGSGMDLAGAAREAFIAVGVVVFIILAGRLGLPRLMKVVAAGGNSELMLVVAAASALGAAVLTGAVGLSPELGAFIAGFLLSSTPFRHHISGQITPLRDLFMAVFFTVVGMRVDTGAVLPVLWAVGLGVLIVLAVKSVVIAVSAWFAGAATQVAARAGLSLGQGGEFSLLVLTNAAALGLIGDTAEGVTIAVVVATLVVTPVFLHRAEFAARLVAGLRPAPWFKMPTIADHPSLLEADGGSRPPRAIIAGFGPVGRACAAALTERDVPHTVVELNARTVWSEAAKGVPILYGDVTNPEVLENAGIDHAEVIVFTMPDGDAVFRGVRLSRTVRPEITILVRAPFMQVAHFAKELGADEAFVEETAVADALAARLTQQFEGDGA